MEGIEIRETVNLQVTITNKIPVFLALVLFISFASCSKGEVYFRYHQINKGMWHRDSVLSFTMDSIGFNPFSRHDLTIEITSTNIYPFQDIWLQVEHNLNDTIFQRDTLYSRLTDDYGRWLGGGTVGIHQLTIPYKSAVYLDTSRVYMLNISHLMNSDPLLGVEKIGLKVVDNP